MVRKVRTPFQPNPVKEVSESEYTDLLRQGVVLEDLTEQVEEPPAQTEAAPKTTTETKKPTPLTFSTRTTSNTTKEEQ